METLTSNSVAHEATTGTDELARFFPGVDRVQIRAIVKPRRAAGSSMRETVTVEFASATHAIFISALPLEFDDLIQLQPAQSRGRSEARVMAVQYQLGRKAVAVQFLNAEVSWVNRP